MAQTTQQRQQETWRRGQEALRASAARQLLRNQQRNGTTPAPATPAVADEFDAESAATIKNLLRTYGLDELIPQVDDWVRQGLSWPEIEAQLMTPSTTAGAVVDRLYPVLRQRREAGLTPVSIQQIQANRQIFHQAAIENDVMEAFPDIKGLADQYMSTDRSAAEFGRRLDLVKGNVAALAAHDPDIQAQLEAWQRFYGVAPTLGNLVTMAVNPGEGLPTLERKFAAVAFDQQAGIGGYGDLSVTEAESLVGTGADANQSQQTFGTLTRSRELFNPLDRGEDTISRSEQLDAAFGVSNNSEAARRRIEDRARRRVAQFGGGGGVAASRSSGFGGLSTAS